MRRAVADFDWNLEKNLVELRDELYSGSYRHGSYRTFTIADSKKRDIKAAPFRDRVMHHALVATLEPIFEKGFIFDSYACRRGKGTHEAIDRFQRFMRPDDYVLTMDISRYFASIDHGILLRILAGKIQDDRLFDLCCIVIESSEDSAGKGIPIGNLTSQLFANVYLDQLDQYVKHVLRFRRYLRYMDDFVFFHPDKDLLHSLKKEVTDFLADKLELTVHPHKAQVQPVSQGVNWLGFRLFLGHRLLRHSTVARFVKRVRKRKRGGGGRLWIWTIRYVPGYPGPLGPTRIVYAVRWQSVWTTNASSNRLAARPGKTNARQDNYMPDCTNIIHHYIIGNEGRRQDS